MIVGIGEVLWDMLPSGPQMGGAPANFTCHARALGAEARLVSCVGDDALGSEVVARLDAFGVWTDCISVDSRRPTGTVDVELQEGQPRYVIHEDVAWDFLEATPCSRAAVSAADAVCFGTLGQRCEVARRAIRELVAAAAPGALRIMDVNLRQHFYSPELVVRSLELANVLKLNDTELPAVSGMLGLAGDTRAQLAGLVERYALRLVVLTRGAEGSLLYDGRTWSGHPGVRSAVSDTIGAGDSFTAAVAIGVLSGWPLDRINAAANEVAAYVCSQPGATPAIPPHLRQLFEYPTSHA